MGYLVWKDAVRAWLIGHYGYPIRGANKKYKQWVKKR